METHTAPAIDKSEWGPGPWQTEPDRWEGEHGGFPLLALRSRLGNWCGYVAVPPGHPWHGKDAFREVEADVHGGLTYGSACSGNICHVPKPGEPDDVYWLGFDCHHAWDWAPANAAFAKKAEALEPGIGWPWRQAHDQHYRTLGYVQDECRSLAEQAKAAS